MGMTEEDAKQKWCPFARSYTIANTSQASGFVAINRDAPNGMIPSCIGSVCMAWNWSEKSKLRDIDLVTSDIVDAKPREGYCGLASKPEFGD